MVADEGQSEPQLVMTEATIWQSRVVATAILAGSLFIAGAIAVVGLEDDPVPSVATSTTSTSTTPGGSGGGATVTTVGTGGTATTGSGTATTVATSTPPPTSGPPTSSATTVAASTACGSGNVVGQPIAGSVSEQDGTFRMGVSARVRSEYDRDAEITDLVIRVTFSDGSTRDVDIDTSGTSLSPGSVVTFDGGIVESQSSPTNVDLVTLSFQPVGQPDCEVTR